MKIWNTDFHGISIRHKPQSVHIKTDGALLAFLAEPGTGSVALAEHLRAEHEARYGRPLDISVHSLSIEILGHVFADKFAIAIQSLMARLDADQQGKLARLMQKIQARTEEIDCGESAVDHDRFVWDLLAPFHSLIYLAFGAGA